VTLGAPRQRLLAHLAMLAFSALIAGSFTTGALAVPYIHPVPLNAVRFLLAAILMGAVAFGAARNRFALPPAPWRYGIMGALMAVYFTVGLDALAARSLYVDRLEHTRTMRQVAHHIEEFRDNLTATRTPRTFPH